MTPTFLLYVLPVLAGYAFFLLISGRFQPFRKPKLVAARPSWLIGLWFGISVTLVALLTLQLVNPLASDTLTAILPASAALLALMLVPGFPVYYWYRSLLQDQQALEWQHALAENDFSLDEFDYLALPAEPELNSVASLPPAIESEIEDSRYELDETLIANANQLPSDESYDAAFEREYDRLLKASRVATETEPAKADEYSIAIESTSGPAAATNKSAADSDSTQLTYEGQGCKNPGYASQAQIERSHTVPAQNTPNAVMQSLRRATDSEAYHLAFDQWHNQVAAEQNRDTTPVTETDEFNVAFIEYRQRCVGAVESDPLVKVASVMEKEPVVAIVAEQGPLELLSTQELKNSELESARIEVLLATQLLRRERELKVEFDLIARRAIQAKETEAAKAILEAREKTRTENRIRLETEKHLRITRRALSRLESEARSTESSKSDEMIELEQEFEERIKIAAKAESALLREQKLRSDLEREMIQAKQSVLAARRDARKNTAARAKVLTTANKAIEFARHTVEARSKVEADLQKLKEQIQVHQATISSLIDTLDHEKSKSREEVSFLSKQLMQKEIELEKKSIGSGNLTSRLVKKVARAKTVTG